MAEPRRAPRRHRKRGTDGAHQLPDPDCRVDLLFSGYGLGIGQVRPLVALPMALAFFAAEAALSTVWLKYFAFGPAEWLWRTLTYARYQPIGRRAAA